MARAFWESLGGGVGGINTSTLNLAKILVQMYAYTDYCESELHIAIQTPTTPSMVLPLQKELAPPYSLYLRT